MRTLGCTLGFCRAVYRKWLRSGHYTRESATASYSACLTTAIMMYLSYWPSLALCSDPRTHAHPKVPPGVLPVGRTGTNERKRVICHIATLNANHD